MDRRLRAVELLHIGQYPFRLAVCDFLRFSRSFVLVMDGKSGIEVGCLMETALEPFRLKTRLFKDLSVGHKINLRTCLPGLSYHRKQSVHQLYGRDPSLICVMVDLAVLIDRHIHMLGKGVHHGRTYSVKTAACLVSIIVEFPSCVQGREYNSLCRDPLFMHLHRDSPGVVADGTGAVRFQRYPDVVALPGQMFIDRVIHDLVY